MTRRKVFQLLALLVMFAWLFVVLEYQAEDPDVAVSAALMFGGIFTFKWWWFAEMERRSLFRVIAALALMSCSFVILAPQDPILDPVTLGIILLWLVVLMCLGFTGRTSIPTRTQPRLPTDTQPTVTVDLLDHLDSLSGKEFEQWVAEELRGAGFECTVVGGHGYGDFGLDVIAELDGIKLGIQAKRHQGKVGNSAVMAAFTGCNHYHCDKAAVVTQSLFTGPAWRQARRGRQKVFLVDRKVIADMAERLRGFVLDESA